MGAVGIYVPTMSLLVLLSGWSVLESVMNFSVGNGHTLLVVSRYYSLHLPWSKLCPCILVCGATSYATPCTT